MFFIGVAYEVFLDYKNSPIVLVFLLNRHHSYMSGVDKIHFDLLNEIFQLSRSTEEF